MLDEQIARFVSEGVRVKAHEFDQQLTAHLLEIDTQFARAGQFRSSLRVANGVQQITQDLGRRAEHAYKETQRGLTLYPQEPNQTLASDLVSLLITQVRGQAKHLQRLIQQRFNADQMDLGPAYEKLNNECEHLNDRFSREIPAMIQETRIKHAHGEAANTEIISHSQMAGITAHTVNITRETHLPLSPPVVTKKRWWTSIWAWVAAVIAVTAGLVEILHYFGIARWEKH